MPEGFKHFSHTACEFYPCHHLENQNCLFCYCPLYTFECGGNYTVRDGVKDCSDCVLVHGEGSFEFVQVKLKEAFRK